MRCLKCGRELKEDQVFCAGCQEDMESYPVKPGTPIQLPLRSDAPMAKKKSSKKKKALKPEEQIPRLRSNIRWLTVALIGALIAFTLSTLLTLYLLDQRDTESRSRIGQNYTVTGED